MKNKFWTAFGAGFLAAPVYGRAAHLLPRAETEPKKYSSIALSAGILVAFIIILSKA